MRARDFGREPALAKAGTTQAASSKKLTIAERVFFTIVLRDKARSI
jgi:hypothetical protein